jgi:hypothetical protein
MKLKTNQLKLGDVVQAYKGKFGTAIVNKVEGNMIRFFRPYSITADFKACDEVICYTGIEEFALVASDNIELEVYERKELK